MNVSLKQLLRRIVVFTAILGAHGAALTIACSIPGGTSCETIANECPSGTTGYTMEWQGFCCGTQEIQGSCCEFYCEKRKCLPSNTLVCSRLWISTTPSFVCGPPMNANGDRHCIQQMGGGG